MCSNYTRMTTKVEEGRSMKLKLSSVRISKGYTAEAAANHLGITTELYEAYENNPGSIPKIIACKIKKLYEVLLEDIEIK